MENISLKLEPRFAREIDLLIKRNRYSTKTEFIREAIRDKVKELKKQESLDELRKIFGSSKRKMTEETDKLHRIREELTDRYEKKFEFK